MHSPAKARPTSEPHVEAILTTIRGTQKIMGLGATSIWALIAARELRVVRFGQRGRYAGRTLVEVASIHEAIARRLATGKAA